MIQFEVNKRDFDRIMRDLDRVAAKADRYARDEGPRRLAVDYKQFLLAAIFSGRYDSLYAGYNLRYSAWKAEYGRATGFWTLFGDLVQNIKFFKTGTGWFTGVPEGVFDSGGKSWLGHGDKGESKEIAWYGWIMELGGSYGRGGKHPARPIFGPTLEEFSQTKAMDIADRLLIEVGRAWG